MNDFNLWMTIRRLIYQRGQCLLDLLLYVADPLETEDYSKRYYNFNEEFNRHFSSGAFYSSQVGAGLPLLTLTPISLNNTGCTITYALKFDGAFATVSPSDCKDNTVQIPNTPEAIYAYRNSINECLRCILCDVKSVNMSDCIENQVSFKITNESYTPLRQKDEIQFFTNTYTIYLNNKC